MVSVTLVSIKSCWYRIARYVAASEATESRKHVQGVPSGGEHVGLGLIWGGSLGWLAYTVSSYCRGNMVEYPKSMSTKPSS